MANFRTFMYKGSLPKFFPLFLKTSIVAYSPKQFFKTLKKIYYLRSRYQIADFR